ncbi:MAG: glycerol-3-phosphate dehydrogenase/oxidase [Planctomycetaceae bacterium]
MHRDPRLLTNQAFDVVVVGGGIYGSWMAFHAAVAGLKVALIEKSDWGSATSSASSKLLHGGLRYLERYEFGLVRKSLRERRELSQRLPHQVRPLRFLVPVYRDTRVGRWRMNAGLWLYDRLAGRRQPVGAHEWFSAPDFLKLLPSLKNDALLGGYSYGDCGTDDARLVLEIVASAIRAGAVACHYVKADELLTANGRATGVRVTDLESGSRFDVTGSIVINAAGPWVNRQFGRTNDNASPNPAGSHIPESAVRLTKGVHLVMPALESPHAVLLTSKSDGRVFFLIPWYGRTLLGTTDTDFHGDPESVSVEMSDIDYLLSAANSYLQIPWTHDDIHGSFAGLRTLQEEAGRKASGVSREWLFEETVPGLWTSIGGKLTSARVDAIEAVDRILASLKRPRHHAFPEQEMAWCPDGRFFDWLRQTCSEAEAAGLDAETATECARRHGARMADIIALVKTSPDLAARIVRDLPFCRAEVVHAARSEMVRTLVDLLRRRIPLLILTRLTQETITDVCDLAAPELGWDAARCAQEVATVNSLTTANRA